VPGPYMPRQSTELAARVHGLRPELPVVLLTATLQASYWNVACKPPTASC